MAGASEPFDRGLQLERTDLAWRRTALGFFANAGLIAHLGTNAGPAGALYAVAAVAALTGALALAHAGRVYDGRAADLAAGRPAARAAALRALWLATTGLTAASLAVVAIASS